MSLVLYFNGFFPQESWIYPSVVIPVWVLLFVLKFAKDTLYIYCCSVAKSCPTLQLHGLQVPGFCILHYLLELLKLSPLSWWCHPTISSSIIPFSSCIQSFPSSESFSMTQLFVSCGQSIGASASAWVLPMNIKCWYPLELTGLISLLSKELSRVFSSTTVRKHQFFGTHPSLWSNSHISTWLLEKL